jgi:hypothetical protein
VRPRIAFLTGQSDPTRCALSPQQSALLAQLAADAKGIDCVALNYPWRSNSEDWRPVPMWRASSANARQYLAARCGIEAALPAARAWLWQAPRSLLLVGSCGLSLLEAMLGDADDAAYARLRVIAYGAVGPRWPRALQGHSLRGRGDWIARALGPAGLLPSGVSQQLLDCGHLDYLQRPQTRAAVLAAARAQLGWLRGESCSTQSCSGDIAHEGRATARTRTAEHGA